MTRSLTLTRPDDWHLHLRDGAMLGVVTPDSAADFGRAWAAARDGWQGWWGSVFDKSVPTSLPFEVRWGV